MYILRTHTYYTALKCSCNDKTPLSDCRWEEWTCTIDTSLSACYARRSRRADGSNRTDLGCVYTIWNPTFCSITRETVAIECCIDSDMCNVELNPTFLQPVDTPPPSGSTTDGSGAPTMIPTPTATTHTPPQGGLQLE